LSSGESTLATSLYVRVGHRYDAAPDLPGRRLGGLLMSVQRPTGPIHVVIVILTALASVAACGGSTSSGATATSGQGSTPAAATPPAEPPADGNAAGTIPPIFAATYAKGAFHADISGDKTGTLDLQLRDGFSAEGSTFINYGEVGGDEATILTAPELIGVSASLGQVSIVGSTVDRNHCDVVITQSDATRLAGTFDCGDLVSFDSATGTNISLDMRGTFEASP
jgi:hypothetical protein